MKLVFRSGYLLRGSHQREGGTETHLLPCKPTPSSALCISNTGACG